MSRDPTDQPTPVRERQSGADAEFAERSLASPPKVSCIICATPRSGSWLLADELLKTGVAGRPEEYFRLDWYERFVRTGIVRYQHMKSHRRAGLNRGRPDAEWHSNDEVSQNRSFPEFLRRVQRIATTPNGVLSLKIHWRQLAQVLPSLRAFSGEGAASNARVFETCFPNTHYVFLRRADKVRQAISFHRALQSGIWWSLAREKQALANATSIDLDEVDRLQNILMRHEKQWEEFLRESARPILELSYEEVSRRPKAAVAKVLDLLGLDPVGSQISGKPRLRRQADRQTDRMTEQYWIERRSGLFNRSCAKGGDSLSRTRTRASLIVAENFFGDPAALRAYALEQPFYLPYGHADCADGERRPIWMASRFKSASECPLKSSPQLIRQLEDLTGEEIDMEFWRADFPVDINGMPSVDHRLFTRRGSLWNCCFHCKPDTGEQVGTGIHNHIEDSWNEVGPDGWSGIVYLNAAGEAPPSSGLKIWRNRRPGGNSDWMTPSDDWELVDSLGNVPNRLILYRGNLPHSGSPGWGRGLATGRLCLTFYFRTVDAMKRRPLELDL